MKFYAQISTIANPYLTPATRTVVMGDEHETSPERARFIVAVANEGDGARVTWNPPEWMVESDRPEGWAEAELRLVADEIRWGYGHKKIRLWAEDRHGRVFAEAGHFGWKVRFGTVERATGSYNGTGYGRRAHRPYRTLYGARMAAAAGV